MAESIKCPRCGSYNINIIDKQWDGWESTQIGYCEDCGLRVKVFLTVKFKSLVADIEE